MQADCSNTIRPIRAAGTCLSACVSQGQFTTDEGLNLLRSERKKKEI